jgi:murein DD-endopeptidase MepM/ murein hydrolase activator NlpD
MFKRFLTTIFTPVTIMLVPHSRAKALSLRIPSAGIVLSVLLFLVGTAYVLSAAVRTLEYRQMSERLDQVSSHYEETKSALRSLKTAESELRRLLGLKSKKQVLEAAPLPDSGSLDMEALRKQIDETMTSVADIRRYIAEQKDLYLATPEGWPVPGSLSSGYGNREHPTTGEPRFHSGVDVAVAPGTKVRVTADGIVSFSGFTAAGGNTVVIEHGHGFSTAYAHNEKNLVRVGRRVKRHEAIAVSGSTGVSTGPHVHYEVWKNGHHVNPAGYLARR